MLHFSRFRCAAMRRTSRLLPRLSAASSVCAFVLALTTHARAQEHLSDHVNTLRGSASDGGYSYGNTFPAVTLPFGFNFWTPVSSSNSHSWIFDYRVNAIEGFAASHEPSPWIGDHGAFQLMPMVGSLQTSGSARRASYDHSNETARAHYYSVKLDNGIRAEFTPTDHAVVFKFTYPAAQKAYLLFDTEDEVGAGNTVQGNVTIDRNARTVEGQVDHRGPRIYYFAQIDKAIAAVHDGPNAQAAIEFSTSQGEVVTIKLATSFISVQQAKANLNEEVGAKTFDQVFEEAQRTWDKSLGKIEIEGATDNQKVTFYSNLYRAFMYPNSMWENVNGKPRYFSPYANQLKDGKIYVNNGFWDTFRAAWPLYALLVPEQTGIMLDGFVQAYKDGGWTPRWSGPGYIDIMVGSHSDIIFADAYVKGITNFDTKAAYDSMLKNALVYSSDGALGRKGNARSIFKGYIPVEDLGESAAWYLEDISADFGIARMAAALGDETYRRYFENKALTYVNLFSPSVGFFRGRRANGDFRTPDADFYPNEWGYEFTEGCAWHYATAAHNDPQGMANLYGGREQLSAKIDSLFAASADFRTGSYGGTIHEMLEARDTGMGQYAHANEPIHHMLYMYNYAGTPWKAQQRVRDVLDEAKGIYGPGFDGRGYLGDEDNGQMSAWYVFSAMGFYPASPGHPEYTIGSPLFRKITLHLENGKDFVISAPENGHANRYVQSAELAGKPHTRNYLTHDEIMAGGTLDLTMGSSPSEWGSAPVDLPTSETKTARAPVPAVDTTQAGIITASEDAEGDEGAAEAFDDNSGSKWLTDAQSGYLQVQFPAERRYTVSLYTVTSGDDEPERDPKAWKLLGSNDGSVWDTLDTQADVSFAFRRQTKVFAAANEKPYARYRLDVTANAGGPLLQISEVEFLGDAPVEAIQAEGSTPCADNETPAQAVDGRMSTKWCSNSSLPELVVDLGRQVLVNQIIVKHAGAGGEDVSLNSRDFALSVSNGGVDYKSVAEVQGNTASETQHTFEVRPADHVKLVLSAPTQSDSTIARIYELEVYGRPTAPPAGEGGAAGAGGATGVNNGGLANAGGAQAGGGVVAGAAASGSGARDPNGRERPDSGERGCCSTAAGTSSGTLPTWLGLAALIAMRIRRPRRHALRMNRK